MKINGYELKVVCANKDKNTGTYGDIYDSMDQCLSEHPEDDVLIGYYLSGEKETPDWFNTLDDVLIWLIDNQVVFLT